MKTKEINHAERAHALLSASGSSRWLNCTPSAVLEDQYPNKGSVFADEGTLAHELAEVLLNEIHRGTKQPEKLAEIESHKLYSAEMREYVNTYVEYVGACFAETKRTDAHAVLFTEVRLDLTAYIPEGFGTIDNVICANGVADVIDLKYGKGVRVSAVDNSQLKLYALGAVEAFAFAYDVHTVRLHIHQPRLDAISVFELPLSELIEWGESTVKQRAALAINGAGDLMTGDWCAFCRHRNRCTALAAEAEAVAALDFAPAHTLTDEQLLSVYAKADRVTRWLSGLSDYLLQQALEGKTWPGLKLVEGRSNRTIADKEAARLALEATDLDPADYIKTDIVAMGQLEKLLGKSGFDQLIGPYVVKPPGKPALVDESDKRPPFDPQAAAASDFD